MTSKPKKKKELCAMCGGELRNTAITHEERRGKVLYLFENVPAQVCAACGEVWIEGGTLEEVDRLIRQGQPVRKLETPVYDFALTTGAD